MNQSPQTLSQACRDVLLASEPAAKVMAARYAARQWRLGRLSHCFDAMMPNEPARPALPVLLPVSQMPKRKRGASDKASIAMLHALAHIEFSAIDLAFDMAGRFGALFPPEFIDDWMRVGADEAMHFALLDRRLKQFGSHYGALPAHAGLWQAAEKTSGDILARLAIVPMVLEARGLDVTPATIKRFADNGDHRSAAILRRIYNDEIQHVAAGTKWFESACRLQGKPAHETWKCLVKNHFRDGIKGPFNDSARYEAGLTMEYYG